MMASLRTSVKTRAAVLVLSGEVLHSHRWRLSALALALFYVCLSYGDYALGPYGQPQEADQSCEKQVNREC